MNFAEKMVLQFIEKSGGLDKIEAAVKVLKDIPKGKHAAYVGRISEYEDGSRRLVAAALLGFTLAAMTGRANVEAGRRAVRDQYCLCDDLPGRCPAHG